MLLSSAAKILLLFKRLPIAKRRVDGWVLWQKRWNLCIKTRHGIWWSFQRGRGRKGANGCSRKKKAVSEKWGEKFKAHLVAKGYSQ
jgi:hypothetical protein